MSVGRTARNCVFAIPRWSAEATWDGDAGYAAAAYPLSNLGTLPLLYVWRTTGVDADRTWFVGTLPQRRPVRCISIVAHNLTSVAEFELDLWDNPTRTGSPMFSTRDDVYPRIYPWVIRRWEDPYFFGGRPSDAELAAYRRIRPIWLPETFRVQSFRLRLIDEANPAGYLQVGLCDVAWGWQTSVNFNWGHQFGPSVQTRVEETESGEPIFDERPQRLIHRISIDDMPRDEVMVRAFDLIRSHDAVRPFTFVPDPGEPQHWLRDVVFARLMPPEPFTRRIGNGASFTWTLKEY
ncbi:MAG: hypothetical protein J0H82_30170 [Alphaproteobacteria bacterium]|nr:hypothetical protein [Alphaproteobacteria bacterium]